MGYIPDSEQLRIHCSAQVKFSKVSFSCYVANIEANHIQSCSWTELKKMLLLELSTPHLLNVFTSRIAGQ